MENNISLDHRKPEDKNTISNKAFNNMAENKKQWENYTVDVIIPAYHPDDKLQRLLKMINLQTVKPAHILILQTVNDLSERMTEAQLTGSNITVIPIDKKSFDHGGTRRYGASLSNADILMFMTQDAVPEDEYLIERLLQPYEDPKVAATYARQLPDEKSDILECYTRNFNYPDISRVKSSKDIKELGVKTFFCSNVCATYRNEIYVKLGGFVEKTIFNEDMIMAFGIIGAGYKIAYAAQARVIHAHRYSYLQQFSRNFDLGVSHRQYAELFNSIKSESEGVKLVKQSLKFLVDHKEYLLIPDLILNSGFKYVGYLLGKNYKKLPKKMVVSFSMNKAYWNDYKPDKNVE